MKTRIIFTSLLFFLSIASCKMLFTPTGKILERTSKKTKKDTVEKVLQPIIQQRSPGKIVDKPYPVKVFDSTRFSRFVDVKLNEFFNRLRVRQDSLNYLRSKDDSLVLIKIGELFKFYRLKDSVDRLKTANTTLKKKANDAIDTANEAKAKGAEAGKEAEAWNKIPISIVYGGIMIGILLIVVIIMLYGVLRAKKTLLNKKQHTIDGAGKR